MPQPICDYLFLTCAEWDQCRATADALIDAAKRLPRLPALPKMINLAGRGVRSSSQIVNVNVAGPNAPSPEEITAKTSILGSITVIGLMAPWPFKTDLSINNAQTAANLRVTLVGAIAHELTHCLALRSGCFDQTIWNEADQLSRVYATSPTTAAYRDYVLNPYERHAHATQLVSAAALQVGAPTALKALSVPLILHEPESL
jgi:hypothetical protein